MLYLVPFVTGFALCLYLPSNRTTFLWMDNVNVSSPLVVTSSPLHSLPVQYHIDMMHHDYLDVL